MTNAQALTEESQTEESQSEDAESEDSLPELVSDEADTTGDSGYAFLNMPPSTEDEDAGAKEKTETKKKRNCTKLLTK